MTTTLTRCLIVDDEALARELIETHLKQLNGFEVVASCASAIEASQVLQSESVDLMFLDIEMPVLKGTDFYTNLANKPKVIFTTAYRDYAVDGFELNAVDYLLKPVVFARFFRAIERYKATLSGKTSTAVSNELNSAGPATIFVRKDRKQVKLVLQDILYVQGLKDYVKVVMSADSHVIKSGIGAFAEQLGSEFVRIHKSFIVNRRKVTAFTNYDVEIGEIELPIGERYRAALEQTLMHDSG
ncbi:DNA-binding response regulator [Arenicella chitinivorans]|uniref:DNA-binding response regulator n=1 Tax=Arenicella chitinivorans TaxID=1329800 RepID=A0A918RL26_9GAMM|nr:LytTR family DNA-binding domain-containing protein [Arenicella chitinivorans]GHA03617.1 DNA-binding response regulator [Arenicella chitinivorans]